MLAYYNLAFNDKQPAEAVAKYVGSKYIQHNPHVAWPLLLLISRPLFNRAGLRLAARAGPSWLSCEGPTPT